jgi:RimJ/RimL family protein N-acetyltransferase
MESRNRRTPAAGTSHAAETGKAHENRRAREGGESQASAQDTQALTIPGTSSRMRAIDTPRLFLRLPDAEDAQPLLDIHEHPDVIKYVVSNSMRRGISGAWSSVAMMLGHWQLRGYGQWTVVEKASGEVIGRVGLWNPEGWPGVELGWIIRHSRWGNGFATEAAQASLDWAWRYLPIDHIISIIQPDNLASIRVAQKIGERLEKTQLVNGAEAHIYGIRRP